MKKLALLVLIGVVSWPDSKADSLPESKCPSDAQQLAECLDAVSALADKRLNAVYSLIIKMLGAGSVDPDRPFYYDGQRDLIAAERAWIKFRDAQCAAEVSLSGPMSASGSVSVTGSCLLTMTRERIAHLEEVADEIAPDSNLCAKTPDVCKIK